MFDGECLFPTPLVSVGKNIPHVCGKGISYLIGEQWEFVPVSCLSGLKSSKVPKHRLLRAGG